MIIHGFRLIRDRTVHELNTLARLYRHEQTGAELLSLISDDENKVFGITFRTPPDDSTGVAHILEHSVLCGSRKYPLKEPFVEILKGSLQTFLNAFTYPDRTCYPVASQNLQDFYNLIDVYLDAVLYPRITRDIFQQEGWHYSLTDPREPLRRKGVVYNEMKGVYSSPDSLLNEAVQHSLFPGTTYGYDSGGDPAVIPSLTYEQFRAFHQRFYHPSNARIFFSGDDSPEERLRLINEYLKDFDALDVDSSVALQQRFSEPHSLTRTFPSGGNHSANSMICVSWLLDETTDLDSVMAHNVLSSILLGMPGSPLRKALIESGLGEDLVGGGLEDQLRQMFFSVGLKGVTPKSLDAVESLILNTLSDLSRTGIDGDAVEAAVNTLEFALRENNTGSYPRGLVLMLRVLPAWLYGGDPLLPLAYETPLALLKERIGNRKDFFESLIETSFLKNPHRTRVVLHPDPDLAREQEQRERETLSSFKESLAPPAVEELAARTNELRALQEQPDSPEALRTIPSLTLKDLERTNKTIPLQHLDHDGVPILFHDLFTSNIAYIDVGFDLHGLPRNHVPYIPLFCRALLEMGTQREPYVTLLRRIGRKTGGINTSLLLSSARGRRKPLTKFFLRGKGMIGQIPELLAILKDILTEPRLDDRERFRQILLEEKARLEERLIPGGHQIVGLRLRSAFNESDRVAEELGGISSLFFLRNLIRDVESNWTAVLAVLQDIARLAIARGNMLVNVTVDDTGWRRIEPELHRFIETMPAGAPPRRIWRFPEAPTGEGLIVPSQVNYVGKGADLSRLGYRFHGSAGVITRYLRNSWLWDSIRVQGGAYGAFCTFDRLSGVLAFLSYRDPNIAKTLAAFDDAARFLRKDSLTGEEVTKAIIGAIGDMDSYQLPDAKGFISMVRYLAGITDRERQGIREEILATTADHFRSFADVLDEVARTGQITVLGSEEALRLAETASGLPLHLVRVL